MYDIMTTFRAKNKELKGIKLKEIKFLLANKNSVSPGGYKYKKSNKYIFIVNQYTNKVTRLDCVKKYYDNMEHNRLTNCSMIQTALKIPHCSSCSDCHLYCIDNFKDGLIK